MSDRASEDERITPIETERLRAFRDHPFKVMDDPEMSQLVESIRHYGIVNPLIVRLLPEGVYEIMKAFYAAMVPLVTEAAAMIVLVGFLLKTQKPV